MDRGYEKEPFVTIKIKRSVVVKFRKYSKYLGHSQSMALLMMLEFFESNGISPKEQMAPKMQTLERLLKRRINHVIGVIRELEKNQTQPTVSMLRNLFEGAALKDRPKYREKGQRKRPPKFVEKKKDIDEF
ncbi:BfmA/BtgA family mobilization protein [Galbibacter sp. PAP.153]|uniref:BfmA/BtgA family mobilization protein n=1 Tax=Galbibacter sp. PAP.153 TaxID=3104623 RepID=UPI003008DE0B